MAIQTIFRRYELKYILTPAQKAAVMGALAGRMALDAYGRTTIRNLYFDTDSYRLIRQSIERPVYKEKLRLRSYRRLEPGGNVFVELKKKYRKVTYKRRLVMPETVAIDWLCCGQVPSVHTQIEEEIEYFRQFYATLAPRVFLSYEREAFAPLPGVDIGVLCGDFRVTFDENILARADRLSLEADVGGQSLLDADKTLMEVKTAGGLPLWLVDVLTREEIRRTSFSKYGTYYRLMHAERRQVLDAQSALTSNQTILGGKNYA